MSKTKSFAGPFDLARLVLAAFARLVADDARATPALPQGVEEWVEKNAEYSDRVYECHAKYQSMKKYVAVDDLMNLLSGMAIVPVKPTPEMINAALPSALRESDEDKYRAMGEIICIWDEMLAAHTATASQGGQ